MWVTELFSKAKTNRELLDVIVSVLKNKLDYQHSDFYFVENSQSLMIRNTCMITWDKKRRVYLFSFSAATEILGGVMLINCLHKNDIHNIEIRGNFFASTFENEADGYPKVYYGADATKQYSKEIYMKYKKEISSDIFQTQLLLNCGNDGLTH